MTDDSSIVLEQPREVRKGHLSQWRAGIRDDRVRVEIHGRKHSFQRGTHENAPPRRVWEGNLEEAKQLHAMLEKLFYDEEAIDFAD